MIYVRMGQKNDVIVASEGFCKISNLVGRCARVDDVDEILGVGWNHITIYLEKTDWYSFEGL